jgi:hypothetical protein
MSVVELEAAISNLPPEDFARIRAWFYELDNLLWDKQMEEDAASGRLDNLRKEVESDIAAGRVKPLNEVINGS